jgi:probable rRNA maturation factor
MRSSSSAAESASAVAGKTPKLKLEIQYATEDPHVPSRTEFRKWVRSALKQDAEIALRVVDATEGRDLNRNFRGRDYATNVLTFVYDNIDHHTQSLAGDIVLCAPIIESEASQQHKMLTAHYAHLTVHGVLHLQGYDHQTDADAAEMERLETHIVEKLGYKDPYRGTVE